MPWCCHDLNVTIGYYFLLFWLFSISIINLFGLIMHTWAGSMHIDLSGFVVLNCDCGYAGN
jgi:hypothetical protein